ncbi:MAG: PepSY-associated TM helix domain-containing protein [Candidatus Pseudobacter hemicellulosilyticus]|uniref:PepSY-associated TM helix domain-containing protein n=1 Tax=Candidatus Pseudobacter hemicellulosilyticus TaxID=3121375 RepID=A0AAJ5WRZ2_9BACT|nr:MAG: PepSY-associated TM helix domain-containing protein [Pseudobacter sp.]
MNLRRYNIYFHTHTISGIIISAILFVIFFAGSFAFFKNEISAWQKNTPNASNRSLDYNSIMDSIAGDYNLYGRDISLRMNPHSRKIGVSVSASKDTAGNKGKGGYFYVDPQTFATADYAASYDLGEFLYRLHFLAQVNSIARFGFPLGYYIAGGVAFIFLFALITGLLVHWQKIVSNFYIFRPWEKLKTLWTDLHTALGVITFPFLLIFAITGAYFLISFPLFTKPTVALQYDGKQDSLYAELGYSSHTLAFSNQPVAKPDIDHFISLAYQQWDQAYINQVEVLNYGDSSMQLHIGSTMPTGKKFTSKGKLVYEVASGAVLEQQDPMQSSTYAEVMQNVVYALHFGQYGGYATKICYFLLGISSCIVIISGILIWLVARKKNNIPEYKRRFNSWLTRIYLAISLGMYPITAASFIAVKLQPNGGMHYIYSFYFWGWLAVSAALVLHKDIYKICRDALLAGSLIGICIPVLNGLVTGNWIWTSYTRHYYDILLIDTFWVLVPACSFLCWWLMKKKQATIAG